MRFRVPAAVRGWVDWLRRFAATTPGAIVAIVAAAVVLCLISGLVGATESHGRTARRDAALQHSEPLADAAQRLYVALSSADAAAATAFLFGGVESPQVRGRYQQALSEAAAALATTTAGADDADSRAIVAHIIADLPVYTGLVETARANNRQGFPVGSAYLREASDVMQNSLLPNASRLTAQRMAAVRDDQRALTGPPWFAVILLLIVIGGAIAASRILLRRTNRRVNLGLAVGACAAVLALLWIIVGTVVARGAIDTGRGGPAVRGENLAQARILAQQARTDEMLELITRGDTTDTERDFGAKSERLGAVLTQVGRGDSPAHQQLLRWLEGHRIQLDHYNAARYREAVDQAIGPGPEASTRRFTELDTSLRDDLAATRAELRTQLGAAGDAWFGSAAGTLVLMVFAAAGVVAGLWPRLKEFL